MSIQRYLFRRIILSVPTIVGVAILVFFSLRLMPGDIVDVLVEQEASMTQEQAETLRRILGLDLPVHEQFFDWVRRVIVGDFGNSLYSNRPVAGLIRQRLTVTAELSILSALIGIGIAFPLGVMSALRPNSWIDYGVRTLSIFSLSAPNFWLAIISLLVLSKYFGWTPPVRYEHFIDDPVANLQKLMIPALILGTGTAGVLTRFIRSSLLEVLRQDYITTARSKGLTERRIVIGHAMKNALIPVMTIVGLQLATIFGGSVIMEQIFSIPGMGKLALTSIYNRDYPITQGLILVFAISYVYANLGVDIAYGWVDPRIRYG